MADATLALPIPRGYALRPCPFCKGKRLVCLTTPPGPRQCPTCRGAGTYPETWLTCGGMLQRARELGLAQ
jgi:DnaJ-class molecular chaperone